MIKFNIPPFVGTELDYVRQAVDAHKICGDGQFTKKCNEWMEKRFGAQKVLLTTSGTTALDMAALLCDLKPDDEVILPSYTFSSTATAFVLAGAKLVFVDVRPDTMNIDETKIEAAITEKTKVIVPVHYAGVACEMDTIMDIAKRHNLVVIEDAAQGVMSSYKGKQAYTQNGKVYTEVYIPLCSCDDFLGDKITIVTDNKYITDSKAYYTLFLKCIDKEKGIYEPINGRTGIIKWKQSKISNTVHCHPLDPGLYNKDIAECFQKYAYEDTNHYCSQNELQYHIEK